MVLVMVARDRRFHSAMYVLIGNLAAADMTVALAALPATFIDNVVYGETKDHFTIDIQLLELLNKLSVKIIYEAYLVLKINSSLLPI